MKQKISYTSNGRVLGNYWGGGSGSYAATSFHSDISKEDLIKQNEEALKSGALDSGMGYESLIGALLIIETRTEIIFEGKLYKNLEHENYFIGDLNEEQKEFLEMQL
jgi:hypothetical protein